MSWCAGVFSCVVQGAGLRLYFFRPAGCRGPPRVGGWGALVFSWWPTCVFVVARLVGAPRLPVAPAWRSTRCRRHRVGGACSYLVICLAYFGGIVCMFKPGAMRHGAPMVSSGAVCCFAGRRKTSVRSQGCFRWSPLVPIAPRHFPNVSGLGPTRFVHGRSNYSITESNENAAPVRELSKEDDRTQNPLQTQPTRTAGKSTPTASAPKRINRERW